MNASAHVRFRACLAICLASIFAASRAGAQQHPNLVRGFDASKAYQVGDFDNIGLLNGNVILTLPIGGSYHVGGNFDYSLTAVYNSKVWDFEKEMFFDPETQTTRRVTKSIPNRLSNAGFGWMVSLGRLLPSTDPANDSGKWLYVAEDASEHVFYTTLHDNEPTEPVAAGIFYTRDGSYLRLVVSGSTKEVQFPDGTLRRFDGNNLLTAVQDRSGNALDIDNYTNPLEWKLSDRHGRNQTVRFEYATVEGVQIKIVDYVTLKVFGGASATYNFTYTPQDVQRHCTNDPEAFPSIVYDVPMLTSIEQPDGSKWVLDYFLDDLPLPQSCKMGVIKSVQLPTLGKVEYEYKDWHLPVSGCPDSADPSSLESFDAHASNTPGVSKRTSYAFGGANLGEWTYEPSLSPPPARPSGWCPAFPIFNPGSEELTVTVTTPLNDKKDHYFSVWPELFYVSANGFVRTEHGLPITHFQDDGATLKRLLSTQTLDCDGGGHNCDVKRSEFLRYERDPGTCGQQGDGLCTSANWRVASTKTVYDDDGNKHATTDFSFFDGLGHYRQATTSGSFGSGNVRSTTTNFNPDRNTYPGSSFSMFPIENPWVLGTFTEQSVTVGSTTSTTRFCFDLESLGASPSSAKGFLKAKRVYIGTSPGSSDVLVRFTPDAYSNLSLEEWFGGDTQSIPSNSNLCALVAIPAGQPGSLNHPKYSISNGYQFGSLKTSQHVGSNFLDVENLIDQWTGLVSTSKDSAQAATDYEYDNMSRLTRVKPTQDAWTRYTYNKASVSGSPPSLTPANIQIRRYPSGTNNGQLTDEQVIFDELGRVKTELRRMPGGTWSERASKYDAAGHKSDVSNWEAQGAGHAGWTKYMYYDAFDRPTTIRPPEGSAHDVVFSYAGVRSVARTVNVATEVDASGTPNGAETPSTTTEIYDRQGRLYKVTEPSGFANAMVTTTYGYDVGDRLSSVSTAGSVTQSRTFTHDRRGFLTSECHPEKGGLPGNGCVTYSNYDARGHAGRKTDGPNALAFSFNAAEQLTAITNQTTGKVLKAFTFGNGVAAADRSRGKVKTAERYNYVPFVGTAYTVKIKETYTYGGEQGRMSARATENFTAPSAIPLPATPNEAFAQGWTYDDLGDVTSLTLPRCTHAGCAGIPAATTITLDYPHSNGRPTSVPGFVNSISYHPNGLVSSMAYVNGVVSTQAIDSYGTPRPASISTSGVANGNNWLTGTYSYDGGGNVKAIGTSKYQYDKVNRVVAARVFPGLTGGGTVVSENYSYDAFGNLVTVGAISTPTSNLTNRLSSGTYDTAGNLTAWNGQLYEYDSFNQMTRFCASTPCSGSAGQEWLYLYTADDERIWSFKIGGSDWRWTLRDLDAKVLTEFGPGPFSPMSRTEDYLYAEGKLVGSGQSTRLYHTDHLGSPRLITNITGPNPSMMAYHAYLPYGREATSPFQDNQRLKFTGHERDLANPSGTADDLDYMHARFFSPTTARFLSTDPVGGDPTAPQSWNRYAYVKGNPLRAVDPTGRDALDVISYNESRKAWAEAWTAYRASPSVGTGVTAAAKFLENAYDSAALFVPGVPGIFGLAGKADDLARLSESTLARNALNGARAEDNVVAELGERVAARRVTLESSTGVRSVVDVVTTERGVIEVKSGGAKLTPNQRAIRDDIQAGRPVVPRGNNARKAGLEPGRPTILQTFEEKRQP